MTPLERISHRDRVYFERNEGRRCYLRRAFNIERAQFADTLKAEGCDPANPPEPGWQIFVLVLQVRPGHRLKFPIWGKPGLEDDGDEDALFKVARIVRERPEAQLIIQQTAAFADRMASTNGGAR